MKVPIVSTGGYVQSEQDRLKIEVERLQQQSDDQLRAEKELAAELERLGALGRAWAEAEDRWFEVSDARPYDAEAAARAALARRAAADTLRAALAEL
jgi:hypothetical protein